MSRQLQRASDSDEQRKERFCRALKRILDEAGLTIKDLAPLMEGYKLDVLYKYSRLDRMPPKNFPHCIGKALGLPVTDPLYKELADSFSIVHVNYALKAHEISTDEAISGLLMKVGFSREQASGYMDKILKDMKTKSTAFIPYFTPMRWIKRITLLKISLADVAAAVLVLLAFVGVVAGFIITVTLKDVHNRQIQTDHVTDNRNGGLPPVRLSHQWVWPVQSTAIITYTIVPSRLTPDAFNIVRIPIIYNKDNISLPVVASRSGVITQVTTARSCCDDKLSLNIIIQHDDGYITHYTGQYEDISVYTGMIVSQGQVIAIIGSGSYLEFLMERDEVLIDPFNYILNQCLDLAANQECSLK